MLKGIDVSRYQTFSDYGLLNQSELAFVFVKATEGIYKDQMFDAHEKGFSKTCLLKGAYHFYRFKTSATDQADAFIDTVLPTFTPVDLPPVLDLEDVTGHLSPDECEKEIQTWLDRVEEALKVKPVIYTGRWFWTDPDRMNNSGRFKDYRLWHAQYGPAYLPMYGGWTRPDFWQFSEKGFVEGLSGAGASIDLDYFLGDVDALWSLTREPFIRPSGKYNAKVEALQFMLNSKGFHSGIQDGKLGENTLKALHDWQKQNGLSEQDTVTPGQWRSLFGLREIN